MDATQPTPPETWRPIPGYELNYEVSDLGRIRSRRRPRTRGGVLCTPVNRQGYPEVRLYADGSGKTWRVHTLVCLAFLGACPEGLEVRHFDDNKLRPILTNLIYGTQSENTLDRVRLGTHNMATKRRCIRDHDITDPANIYLNPATGSRQCRACVRINWAERQVAS